MAKKGNRSLYQYLLETKAELLIRKKEEDKRMFEEEVALGSIIFAIDKALGIIRDKGEN